MAEIQNVPGIISIKNELEALQTENLILAWELPYEQLLTRLSAAYFYLSPVSELVCEKIWKRLKKKGTVIIVKNIDQELSKLEYEINFPAEY